MATKPKPTNPNLKPRLSIPYVKEPDGRLRIAYEVLTEKVRDPLRAVLTDPNLHAALELPAPAAGAAPAAPQDTPAAAQWDAEFCDLVYSTLAQFVMLWATKKGYSAEQARVLAFKDGELALLREPTQKVLDKYFPGGLTQYGVEAALLLTLATVMQPKVMVLRAMAPDAAPLADAPTAAVTPFPQHAQREQVTA